MFPLCYADTVSVHGADSGAQLRGVWGEACVNGLKPLRIIGLWFGRSKATLS